MSVAVRFDRVTKRYLLDRERSTDAREVISRLFRRRRREEFLALRDVSFEVKRGEALGIIGPNGAGKSTTLKILARIVKPTRGTVRVNGKLTALIEVGAGFHPDLTGRENVYLNGSLLGMSRRDVDARFDRIVEFAELAQFIDTPVKRYSSGMQVRLGFSIAASLEPEILLIDEVLAVGDMAFQRKCLSTIEALRRAGTTILFVSHAMETVATVCSRVLLLRRGRIAVDGSPEAVIAAYRQHVYESNDGVHGDTIAAESAKVVQLSGVEIRDANGDPCRVFATGGTVVVTANFRCSRPVEDAVLHAAIHRADGLCCFGTHTQLAPAMPLRMAGTGSFSVTFDEINLMPGSYLVSLRVSGADISRRLADHDQAYGFVVDRSRSGWGTVYLRHAWRVEADRDTPSTSVWDARQ